MKDFITLTAIIPNIVLQMTQSGGNIIEWHTHQYIKIYEQKSIGCHRKMCAGAAVHRCAVVVKPKTHSITVYFGFSDGRHMFLADNGFVRFLNFHVSIVCLCVCIVLSAVHQCVVYVVYVICWHEWKWEHSNVRQGPIIGWSNELASTWTASCTYSSCVKHLMICGKDDSVSHLFYAELWWRLLPLTSLLHTTATRMSKIIKKQMQMKINIDWVQTMYSWSKIKLHFQVLIQQNKKLRQHSFLPNDFIIAI